MNIDLGNFASRLGGRLLGDADLIDPPARRLEVDLIANEIFPYRTFDAETGLYLNRRSVGFIIEATPLLGADDRIVDILADLFRDGIEDHTHIQVISWASPRIGHIIDGWLRARDGAGGVYESLARHRADHLEGAAWRSLSAHAPFLLRNFRIVITAGVEGTDLKRHAPMLQALRESMTGALRAIGGDARILEPRSLIGFLDEILNPRRGAAFEAPAYSPRDFIHRQIMRADTLMTVGAGAIRIETTARAPHSRFRDAWASEDDEYETRRYEARCFSVKSFPEEFAQWRMGKLIGDFFADRLRFPSPVLTVLGVSLPSSTAMTARAQLKSTRSTQQSRTSFAAYQPSLREKADDWRWAMAQIQNGQKFVRLSYQAIVIAEERDADRAEQGLRNIYKSAGWDMMKEPCVQLQSFALALPLTLADGLHDDLERMLRTRTEVTRTCANLAPLQGEYLGGRTPHMLLAGRRGQPFYWSPFGNREGNHNVAILGQSGSGKSVFLQECVAALRGAGAGVVVIDDGRSFEHSCRLQDGAFIEFSLEKKVSLNPFSMVDTKRAEKDKDYRAEALTLVKLMIQQMARAEETIKDAEKGFIDEAVVRVWDEKRASGSIDDVHAALVAAGDLMARDLAQSVMPFTRNGAYGAFFNGPATLRVDNDLTVFELAELEGKPDLRAVVLLAILFLVQEKMARAARARKTAFVIDEAWQLLGDGATGAFIEGFARRCRKYGGALLTAAQSPQDYARSAGARAAFENSDWTVIHPLKPEAIAAARKTERLAIDAATEDILKSLKVSEGEYSECLIVGPHGRHLGRLVLDPFSAALYSSTPETVAEVTRLRAAGTPLDEAIRMIAAKGRRDA